MSKFEPFTEQLFQASYKGIEFEVTKHKSDFGHRHAAFSFPFKNNFEIQEFGKKQATFQITGFLVGKDYLKKRDDLISRVNEGGVGELIHPYLGRLVVFCQSISVSESYEKKGYCIIDFEFLESSKNLPITAKLNKEIVLAKDVDNAKSSALDAFKKGFKYISNKIFETKNAINSAIGTVRDIENGLGSVAQISTDFIYLVKHAQNLTDRIAGVPDHVGNLLDGVCESFNLTISNNKRTQLTKNIQNLILPGMFETKKEEETKEKKKEEISAKSREILNSYKEFYNISLSKKTSNQNIKEIEKFVQTHALASACEYAGSAVFSNIKQANLIRDELVNKIDELLNDQTILGDVFDALYKLRISVYEKLSSIANEIPVVKTYKNDNHNNLIMFCFENFGTVENFDDIISLNNINNPFILKNYEDIKVIKNDNIKNQ